MRLLPFTLFLLHAAEGRTAPPVDAAVFVRQIDPIWAPKTIDLRPDDITTIMGFRGQLAGSLRHAAIAPIPTHMASVYGFDDEGDALTWSARAPEAADYRIAVIYRTTEAGSRFEVAANGMALSAETIDTAPPQAQLNCHRVWLEGALPLKQGENEIVLRMTRFAGEQAGLARKEIAQGGDGGVGYKGDQPTSFRVWSIELAQARALEAIQRRAAAMRANGDWMVKGVYGLFVHWSPLTLKLDGTQMPYEEAVNLFDVEAFADMVEQTGAAWLILTTTHGRHNFPAPIQAIDRVLPGHTTRRDLIMEIADALEKRGVRLMLYYHIGLDEEAWPKAAGYFEADKTRWFENTIAIHREIGERYGKKTWGWFFDDAHKWYYPCDFPWKRYYEAIKTGNPERLVAFNPGTRPSMTPFGDLLASDNGANRRPPMDKSYFAPGGDYANLLQHFSFTLESAWVIKSPKQVSGGKFPDPVHRADELVDYVRTCQAAGVPVTMNILITQDVTREKPFVNEKTLDQLRQVRKAVRRL